MAIDTPVVTPPVVTPPVTPPVVPPVTPPVVPPVTPPVVPPVVPPVTPPVETPKTDAPKPSILGTKPVPKEGEVKPVAPQGAPESYADIKLPDGIAVDAKVLDGFKALAKGEGLSQASFEKFVSFQAQNLKAEIDGRLAAVTAQSETWAKESRDQFGATWEKEFANAAKGIESFGTPKMREILTAVGLDNHPEFVAMFARVGAKIAEGQPVDGKPAGSERVPTEKLMFDKMGPKT